MNNFQWCAIHKKYQTFGTQMNKGGKFLKKLWCCQWESIARWISVINWVDNLNWPPWRAWKLSISPSLWLRGSAWNISFQTLHSGQLPLSIQLIILNNPFSLRKFKYGYPDDLPFLLSFTEKSCMLLKHCNFTGLSGFFFITSVR